MSEPKREITGRLVRRGEDEKAFDREFWRRAGSEARLEAAFEMVREVALFRGQDPDELTFQRTVESLQRRRR